MCSEWIRNVAKNIFKISPKIEEMWEDPDLSGLRMQRMINES
jgi:hypothetical protein